MAIINWKSAVNGAYTNPINWDTGTVPAIGDDAVLGLSGFYIVSLNASVQSVNTLTISNIGSTFAIDATGTGGTDYAITGLFNTKGGVQVGNTGLTAATKVTAGSLTNSGDMTFTGGTAAASLIVNGAVTNNGGLNFVGRANFTGGATLNQGTLAINSGIDDKGGGGATLGVLTNKGDVQFGNEDITTPLNISVAGLNNAANGTIHLVGGLAQTALKVNAGAPATWTGFLFLEGNALLQYTGGSINQIAANSEISLAGANARVARAANPSVNGVLAGLNKNSGVFKLTLGATVAPIGDLANLDTIIVDEGANLDIAGALSNTGDVVIGNTHLTQGTKITAGGLDHLGGGIFINGGAGEAALVVDGPAPALLEADLFLSGNALLQFGSGTITRIDQNVQLSINGAAARIASGTDTTKNGGLSGLADNAGSFHLGNGATVNTTVNLLNASNISIDGNSSGVRGGSTLSVQGTLTNDAFISVGNPDILAPTTLAANGLDNIDGVININGGLGLAAVDINAAAPSTLEGDFNLTGNALLEFNSGAVTKLAAGSTLRLDGLGARVALQGASTTNSALTQFAVNDGVLSLLNGAKVNTVLGTNFVNNNTVNVDGFTFFSTFGVSGGSTLVIGGTLDNNFNFNIGNTNIVDPTTVRAAALDNDVNGNINIRGSATDQALLHILGAAPTSLTGDVLIEGNGLLKFGTGGLSEIGPQSSLVLIGPNAEVDDATVPGTNTALDTLTGNRGTLRFHNGANASPDGDFFNAGTLGLDDTFPGAGGSKLTIAGTLTNGPEGFGSFGSFGVVRIGNSSITSNTELTVGGLVNNDDLFLTSGVGHAILNVLGDAKNTSFFSFTVDTFGPGGSIVDVVGTLTNTGSLTIGNTGITQATNFTVGNLVNTGSVTLNGNTVFDNPGTRATLNVESIASSTLAGRFTLTGNTLLNYAAGSSITSIGLNSTLLLNGDAADVASGAALGSNSALNALAANAGTFGLANGAKVTTSASFTNTFTVGIDDDFGELGGSAFTVAGVLTNNNTLRIGNNTITAATTVTAGGLQNNGIVFITGGAAAAKLAVNAAAPAKLVGDFRLTGNAALQFTGGSGITTITAFSDLFLDGPDARVALAAAPGSNSALTKLATVSGTLSLKNGSSLTTAAGVNLTNFGSVVVDAFGFSGGFAPQGGSTLKIGGASGSTLANVGTLFIGANTITQAVTVNAGALVNGGSGDVNITGGTAKATLALTGAAPARINGDYRITGNALLQYGSGGVLSINRFASLTLDGAQARVALAGFIGSNSALKTLSANSGTFTLLNGALVAPTGDFGNVGTVNVDSGGFFGFGGTGGSTLSITGTLGNTGTLSIGNAAIVQAASVKAAALVNSEFATVNLTGGAAQARLTLTEAAPSTLLGRFNLLGDALLQFGGTAGVNGIGRNAALSLDGKDARVNNAAVGSNTALASLGSNAGTFSLANGATVATGAQVDFFNTGTVNIDPGGFFGGSSGGSNLTIGGELTNAGFGQINIGNANIAAASTIKAESLVNGANATIRLTGGAAEASLVVNGAAPTTLTGSYFLTGDALLNFASGGVVQIASFGTLSLDGADADVAIGAALGTNSALTTLRSNLGTLRLANGAVVEVAGNLTNANTISLDTGFGNLGGSVLTVDETLVNGNGAVSIGNSSMVAPSIVNAARLSGPGTITLTGGLAQAMLNVAAPAPAVLGGFVTINDNAVLKFGSGLITQATGTLTLNGEQARIASGAGDALGKLASNSGFLTLRNGAAIRTAVAFTNTSNLSLDAGFNDNGGSSFTVVGFPLTNSGTISLGHTGIAEAVTLFAKGLNNTGSLNLTGGAGAARALINAAAPTTLTGFVDLEGNAVLRYASGGITKIGAGSSLTLTGPEARVAIATTPNSNSALTTLATNDGTLSLQNGASVSTTTPLVNNSFLAVDTNFFSGGSTLTVAGKLTNAGNVNIGNGGLVGDTVVKVGSLANDAFRNIQVAGSSSGTATLSVTGNSTNAGNMTIGNNGFLELGGSLAVTGQLDFGGGGTIVGGILAGAGTIQVGFGTGTLKDVTIAGPTTVKANFATLVVDGVTLNGALNGGGSSTLRFADTGTADMVDVSGFSTINLADGGANTLTLTDANYVGISSTTVQGLNQNFITVNGGNGDDTVNAGALGGSNAIIFRGGSGSDNVTGGAAADIFFAGGDTIMTGLGGVNHYVFSAPGAGNVVAGFSGFDEILFSNSGFGLGLSGAGSNPQALPVALFNADGTGTFTNATQRFSYETAAGRMFFDADGNGALPRQLVSTFSGGTAVGAADLFFIT